MEQKQKQIPKRLFAILTGLLFAAYAAHNVFIMLRDGKRGLPKQAIIISALVAVLFGLLAVFAWTFEVKSIRFLMIRRVVFILSMLGIIALKLRMAEAVVGFLDFSVPYTVWNGVVYILTLAGLWILLVYYTFIRKRVPPCPRASVVMPVLAMAFFLLSFIIEVFLFAVYRFGMEENMLRTVVMRPVFYFGLISLCIYFLFQPHLLEMNGYITPDDSELIKPEETDYLHSVNFDFGSPDEIAYVKPDKEYLPPENIEFHSPDEVEYIQPENDDRLRFY